LETTATYDKDTEEFIVNSPTQTSYKWWPGDLGKFSTDTALSARLLIDGKDYGIHQFFVPIRDRKTFLSLPGRKCGDIGPKLGFNSRENGFLALDNVRIPRKYMFQRVAKVHADGRYETVSHPKLYYVPMMLIRVGLVRFAYSYLAKSVTIATRYSCVRRQFSNLDDSEDERKVIDYQLQQGKLTRALSTAYCFAFNALFIESFWEDVLKAIKQKDFEPMEEMHVISCGYKGFFTMLAGQYIEECRQACGGHGYLHASGLPSLMTGYVAQMTYEGDNFVLALQVGKHLLKCASHVAKGKEVKGHAAYLNNMPKLLTETASNIDFTNHRDVLHVLEVRAARQTAALAQKVAELRGKGNNMMEITNSIMQSDMIEAARSHIFYLATKVFVDAVEKQAAELQGPLSTMAAMFGLYRLKENLTYLFAGETSYFQAGDVEKVDQALDSLTSELRPNLVGLVDSFSYHDNDLLSALGRFDGNVYETLMDWAKNHNPINQGPLPGFDAHIKPMMGKFRSKM